MKHNRYRQHFLYYILWYILTTIHNVTQDIPHSLLESF